jgi:putative endonuclease
MLLALYSDLNRIFLTDMSDIANIGALGEDIAAKYLKNKGFSVLERNFRRKYGEIDIICEKARILHFVEVKSVSQETFYNNSKNDNYRPEDNLHGNKAKRLRRVIEVYLDTEANGREFEIHLLTVKIDKKNHIAHVAMFEDIVI